MSASAKLSGTAPVGAPTTTTLVKLSGTKLVSTSSSPVQSTTVSTDVGTMTDHHLPNAPEQMVNYFPFDDEQEDKPAVQISLQEEAPPLFDDTFNFDATVAVTRHEALRNIGTYETNMETITASVKKSTKAFG